METKRIIREEKSVAQLTANLSEAITEINETIANNDYNLTVNSVNTAQIIDIRLDFSNLTNSSSKKLAKRIHFYNKKKSLKSINSLFSVFKRIGVITDSVKVSVSTKEKEIIRLRKIYKDIKVKYEESMSAYKTEKGNFYKK
jgi:hypothetical protein